MIALLKAAEPAYAGHFKASSTRQLFATCPWMILTHVRDSDAAANMITVDWSLLIFCSSFTRIRHLKYALDAAVRRHYSSSSSSGERGSSLAAAEATGEASKQTRDRRALLASAARNAMWIFFRGASRMGQVRHMLQHGAPVQLKDLGECAGVEGHRSACHEVCLHVSAACATVCVCGVAHSFC